MSIIPHVEQSTALSVKQAVDQYNALGEFVRSVFKEGLDFGVIPGTGSKPSLYKPGAEKAINFYRYTFELQLATHVEDWVGATTGGEPFFYYKYKARLLSGGILVAEAEGSCNSWEEKYRYRNSERVCPECGKPAIIKGKAEYGGGYICFKKKDGCGAKFADNDPAITDQPQGKVPNERIFDQVNTIQKMAQKRAMVAVALIGCRLSDMFTQDVEDMVYETTWTVSESTPQPTPSIAQVEAAHDTRQNRVASTPEQDSYTVEIPSNSPHTMIIEAVGAEETEARTRHMRRLHALLNDIGSNHDLCNAWLLSHGRPNIGACTRDQLAKLTSRLEDYASGRVVIPSALLPEQEPEPVVELLAQPEPTQPGERSFSAWSTATYNDAELRQLFRVNSIQEFYQAFSGAIAYLSKNYALELPISLHEGMDRAAIYAEFESDEAATNAMLTAYNLGYEFSPQTPAAYADAQRRKR